MDTNTIVKVFIGVVLVAAGTVLVKKGLAQAGGKDVEHLINSDYDKNHL